ncbi:MAG: metal-dependent phosphohydrolase, partial [Proteobacteria bacterium]|nr:metal-dependent phosphohydrolase [Pseudomonadota bacterium]
MESSSKVAEKVFKQKKSDFDIDKLSNDNKLNKLLKSIITEIRLYAEDQIKHIERRAQIGIALSVEKDINKLLEMIVEEARAMSNADAGTLYIVDDDKKNLRFEILQNDTLKTRMGGTSGVKSTLPNVP